MRKIFFALLMLPLILSCTKDDDSPTPTEYNAEFRLWGTNTGDSIEVKVTFKDVGQNNIVSEWKKKVYYGVAYTQGSPMVVNLTLTDVPVSGNYFQQACISYLTFNPKACATKADHPVQVMYNTQNTIIALETEIN
jgi:hypothetical protein